MMFVDRTKKKKSFLSILVLARVRVTLTDTVFRLEHLIDNGDHGVALEIRIKKYVCIYIFSSNEDVCAFFCRFEYFDSEAKSVDMAAPDDPNCLIRPTVFTNKNFVLSGVTFYTDKFSVIKSSSNMTDSSELNLSSRLIAASFEIKREK